MNLRLYNSLTRQVEEFKPLDPSRIKMYVCGPTVYSAPHLGNARPAVVFDILFRVLRQIYGNRRVSYARNITDIDDKIINKSKETGKNIHEITVAAEQIYLHDMQALNVLEPTFTPYATLSIDAMLNMIQRLMDMDAAYIIDNGVYFDSTKFDPALGLAHHNSEDLQHGEHRIEADESKKNPSDFALWKFTTGVGTWDSPWGRGRPGWHIECSAMIEKTLGETIDIHGGGHDLRFPHHEAEIAQSTTVHNGKPLANFWMHNGLITVNGKKMSKSLGNFIEVSDVLKEFPGEVIRYLFLSSHYRSPFDWTQSRLLEAKDSLNSLYRSLIGFDKKTVTEPLELLEFLKDDLNTPKALAFLHSLAGQINTIENNGEKHSLQNLLYSSGQLLGLFATASAEWFSFDMSGDDVILQMIERRRQARSNKDWALADQIRIELNARGIGLEDHINGTRGYKL